MNNKIKVNIKRFGPIIIAVLAVSLLREIAGPEGVLSLSFAFLFVWIANYLTVRRFKSKPKVKRTWFMWFVWLNLIAWLMPVIGAIVAGVTFAIPRQAPGLRKKSYVLGGIGFGLAVLNTTARYIFPV